MRHTRHGEHLSQLTRWELLFPVNCYLVREEDGLTLVDTGMPNMVGGILAAARELGAPIQRIVLTHGHMDHAGGLAALHTALPEAEISLSTREAPLLAGERRVLPGEPQAIVRGGWPKQVVAPTRTLEPGERIGSLRVIAAPGHTPGQIAFLDERDGTLIAGDAYSTHTGVTVCGTSHLLFPFVAMGTWHQPTALATAKTLHALDPVRLATGHGPVLERPGSAMNVAVAVMERALAKGGAAHAS